MPNNKLIDISGELVVPFETPLAYRFYDGSRTEWIPKSQCEWDASDRDPNIGTMTMPEWLAQEKGFI
jgi:hypothetical protein